MSISSMNIHGVSSIKLKAVGSEKGATWRDLQIETAEGYTFTLTLFADDADNLRINLQEAAD
jgi:hypothetical protein